MPLIVPPGGFAGYSQQVPAAQRSLFPSGRSSSGSRGSRRRRRSRAKSARRSSSRRGARAASSKRMKFGSPAWQKKYGVGKFAKGKRRRSKRK